MKSSAPNKKLIEHSILEQDSPKKKEQLEDIKGVIFDFDGVLSSFIVRIGWPLVSAALMVKSNITKEQIEKTSFKLLEYLTTLDKMPKKINLGKLIFNFGKQFGMNNFQALKFIVVTAIVYSRGRKTIIPKRGVREVLKELFAQKYKLILLTNTSRKVIDIASEKIPEIHDFDLILTREDVPNIKPNAIGFFKIMKILNLKANELISIGDQPSDIIAGKRAGVKTIAINDITMRHTKTQLEELQPDFIIHDLRDLPKILKFLRDCIIEDLKTTIDLSKKPLQDVINKEKTKCN